MRRNAWSTSCSCASLSRWGTPRALAFDQPRQTFLLKAPNPIFDRSRCIPQQAADLRTGHALGHQQHSMQAMIITRFFRTPNLVLQSENDRRSIGNLKGSHALMRSQFFNHAQLLMTLCLTSVLGQSLS